jgi:hypothetical protein
MKVDVLYSLIEYLDKVLPIDISKTYKENEKAEIISFIKLFLALGGKLTKRGDDIIVDRDFRNFIMIEFFGYSIIFLDPSKKLKKSIFIGVPGYVGYGINMGELIAVVNESVMVEERLFKSYKEPFPGAWSNDKPWSRKKQKPNKRR